MPTKKTCDSTSPHKKRKTRPSSAAPRHPRKPFTADQDEFIRKKVREMGTQFTKITDEFNKEFGYRMIDIKNRWHCRLKKEGEAVGVNGSKNEEVVDGVDTSKNDVAADGVNTVKEEESNGWLDDD